MPNIKFSQFTLGSYDPNSFVVGYNPITNTNVRIPVTAIQSTISLTTTGSSGSATLIAGVLNIPTYTLSGLGGVPTTRQLTINGTTFDLSANRTWTIPAITSLNSLTAGSQLFATGVNGTDFNIVSSGSTHTFNLPVASSSVTGKLSSSDWINFNAKQNAITLTTTGSSGASTFAGGTLNIPTYSLSGLGGVPTSRTLTINGTAFDLSADRTWTIPAIGSLNGLTAATQTFATGTTGTDFGISSVGSTHTFNLPTASATNRGALSSADWSTFNSKQNAITLTTTGNSGSSTFVGGTLNVPTYTLAGLGGISLTSLSASAPLSYNNGTGAFSISQSSGSTNGFLSSADWTTFNSKQSAIALTTTGSSGAATFISNTLNVPNYTLSGLGGVPTTRTITINGVTQDLSANQTWTIGAGSQTLNQTTLLGNTSNQSIQLLSGAILQTQNVTTSDLLNLTATGSGATSAVALSYNTSGENFLTLNQQRLIWGSSLVNQIQFRASNLTAGIALEMPNVATGTPTIPISVNGVTANTAGDISIAVGGTQTLQQTTTLGNSTTDDIVLIDSSLTGIDTLEFDLTPATTTHAEGRVRWDDFSKAIQVDTEQTGVSVTVGHDIIQRVNNQTGATLLKGRVVYINGQQGGRPTVTLADNGSDTTSATTLGLVMADINNNNNGYVITNGLLTGINTSSFTAGQVLYLGTSGQLTGTKPVAPAHLVTVCVVVTVGILGSVFVQVQNGYELDELHDVLITSPLDNQVLTFDSTTLLWKNEFPARYYSFGFNNISDYVVNGGSGTQNLGAGTLGMSLFSRVQDLLTTISGGNYNFSVMVTTNEQFGGVVCNIGLRVTASSSAGGNTADYLGVPSRTGEFGTNFAVQRRAFTFTVPQFISGAPTEIVKFEVIVSRVPAGSTSIYLSQLAFFQP